MKTSASIGAWINRAALAAALGGGAYFVCVFLYVAITRIGYPFSLEWLEGGSYLQVQRLLTGQPLYAQPSTEYVAMIYPPFYYFVSALASRILGFGFLPLRMVSLASAVGSMVMICLICRRERTGWVPALLASGLFAATYALTGTWFDVARVDMLSVFLLLASIWLLRLQIRIAYAAAGFGIALASLTKQTHLITLACICIYMVAFERRQLLAFLLACAGTLVAAYLLLDRVYSGWYRFFVFRLALGSGEYVSFAPSSFLQTALDFWWGAIVVVLPFVSLFILAYFVVEIRRKSVPSHLFFYAACAAGMVGTAWSVVEVGGYKNDLLPAYAIMAILFGLAVQTVGFGPNLRPAYRAVVLAACAVQFALLHYPIEPQIPSNADLRAGEALVAEIRAQPGNVYVPFHPELALMAGKPAFASWSPMYQLEGSFGGGDVRQAARVKTEFLHAMARQDFSMIILDQTPNWIWGNPEEHYVMSSESVFPDPSVFWPVTGWRTRPEFKMLPMGK